MPDHPRMPSRWTHTRNRALAAGAIVALLSLGAGLWALNLAVHRHHILAAVTAVAWAIVFGCGTVGIVLRTASARRNRIQAGTDRLVISPPRFIDVMGRMLLAALLIAGIAGVVT